MARRKPRTISSGRTKRNTSHTCNGKTRFRDKREADRAIHVIENVNTRTKVPTRAYVCPRCHGWHLTSMRSHPDME